MTHPRTDLAKSRRGSHPEAEFPALLGGTPEPRRVQLTWLQARERMKTSIFTLGTRLKQEEEVPKGTPKTESEDSQHRAHGSAPGRAPEERAGGLLMEEQ